jgi:hypothetical protein
VKITLEAEMDVRKLCFSLSLAALVSGTQAGQGLTAPPAEALWPQWQARFSVQSAGLSALAGTALLDQSAASVKGAALLGDYYFARPALGGFRASGGLMTGPLGSAPWLSAAAGDRVDLAVNRVGSPLLTSNADSVATVPYLGVGYTGATWRHGPAITADVGLVAEHLGGLGRAVFGNQGFESGMRELRLSPVLQLGVRYNF